MYFDFIKILDKVRLPKLRREADLYIGGKEDPYLLRWYIIPRNRFFNIYLHKIVRDDDDRALHDHPWWSLSIIIKGSLREHDEAGAHIRRRFTVRLRNPEYAHRLELLKSPSLDTRKDIVFLPNPCWTFFITGPRIREWGFHCPKGWRHWRDFTDETGARIGKGCE